MGQHLILQQPSRAAGCIGSSASSDRRRHASSLNHESESDIYQLGCAKTASVVGAIYTA